MATTLVELENGTLYAKISFFDDLFNHVIDTFVFKLSNTVKKNGNSCFPFR